MTQRTFIHAQLAAVLGMALLIALPYFLYTLRPEYQELVPFRTNDDGFYMGRLDAVLEGRWSEFQNGITGPVPDPSGRYGASPPARGVAPGLLELVGGILFSWTRLHGPQVSVILTTLIAPLTIPLVAALLRSFEVGRGLVLAASLLYTFVFLAPLQRPIYMSLALPVSLLGLLLGVRLWQRPRQLLLPAAALVLGILPGVYFWSFSWVWAACGFLFFLHLLFLPSSTEKRIQTKVLLAAACLTLIVSSPFFLQMFLNAIEYPFSAEVILRNQIVKTHAVESIPRSVLLTLLTLCSLLVLHRTRRNPALIKSALVPIALVLAAFTVMHQNLLHGLRFTFSSHYYPYVTLSALAMAAWVLEHRPQTFLHYSIVGVATVFLLAGAWDYQVAWILPTAPAKHLDFQHLAPALAHLSDGKRQTILTDGRSAQMVTNWTDDDVIFTPYVRHLLINNEEFAERYCLSELASPLGPDIYRIASEAAHIRIRHLLPEREREFRAICEKLLHDPREALTRYGVDLLLWNQHEYPLWKIPLELFERIAQGEGWSLWKVKDGDRR